MKAEHLYLTIILNHSIRLFGLQLYSSSMGGIFVKIITFYWKALDNPRYLVSDAIGIILFLIIAFQSDIFAPWFFRILGIINSVFIIAKILSKISNKLNHREV